jgi:mRNA interferase RelE/StbE
LYELRYEPVAGRELLALPAAAARRVALAINGLSNDPRPPNCAKLRGTKRDLYRLRVGTYRVIYEIRDEVFLILVVRVARRTERTYRDL